jgi:hypothetical protein
MFNVSLIPRTPPRAKRGETSMKKVLILAGLSAFVLIGAAYPDAPKLAYGAAVMAGTSDVTGPTYRPCRRDRRDDRCIQLYERGVRASYAAWLREQGMGGPDADYAAAPRRERMVRRYREQREERHARRPDRARYAMTEIRCVQGDAHHRMRDDDRRRHDDRRGHDDRRSYDEHRDHGAPADHRLRDEQRSRDGYDGEVRGM